jgi:hypothetical protein
MHVPLVRDVALTSIICIKSLTFLSLLFFPWLQADQIHPVWGSVDNYVTAREKRKQLLLVLSQNEADRLEVWAQPINTK